MFHLAHGVQLSDSLINVLATVDDQAEQLLHLRLHGHHPEPDAHHIQGRWALPQAEGRVSVPQRGHQLHVPLVGQSQVLLTHLKHFLRFRVNIVGGDVAHPAQSRPVGDVDMLEEEKEMVREMLDGESNHLHTWLQIYQLHELCSLGDRGVQDTTLLLHTLRGYIEQITHIFGNAKTT